MLETILPVLVVLACLAAIAGMTADERKQREGRKLAEDRLLTALNKNMEDEKAWRQEVERLSARIAELEGKAKP